MKFSTINGNIEVVFFFHWTDKDKKKSLKRKFIKYLINNNSLNFKEGQ
jgi:hypothetical protein